MRRSLVILLSMLLPLGLLCAEELNLKNFSEEQIYQATLNACQGLTREDVKRNSNKLDLYRAGRTPSKDFNRILKIIEQTSYDAALDKLNYTENNLWTEWLLVNSAYQKALKVCYPQDPGMYLYFNRLLLKADTRGKVLSGATFSVMTVGIGKLLTGVYRASRAVAYGLSTVATSAFAYSIVSDLWTSHQTQMQIEQECRPQDGNCDKQALLKTFGKMDKEIGIPEKGKSNRDFFIDLAKNDIKMLEARLKKATDQNEIDDLERKIESKKKFLTNL